MVMPLGYTLSLDFVTKRDDSIFKVNRKMRNNKYFLLLTSVKIVMYSPSYLGKIKSILREIGKKKGAENSDEDLGVRY